MWTKKRGSLNAVVPMATPCPKSLHGKREKWIARNILQGDDDVYYYRASRESVSFSPFPAKISVWQRVSLHRLQLTWESGRDWGCSS